MQGSWSIFHRYEARIGPHLCMEVRLVDLDNDLLLPHCFAGLVDLDNDLLLPHCFAELGGSAFAVFVHAV